MGRGVNFRASFRHPLVAVKHSYAIGNFAGGSTHFSSPESVMQSSQGSRHGLQFAEDGDICTKAPLHLPEFEPDVAAAADDDGVKTCRHKAFSQCYGSLLRPRSFLDRLLLGDGEYDAIARVSHHLVGIGAVANKQ